MNKFFVFLLFSFSLSIYAQGEANIWYFGERAGLDFNSGTPVALTNGKQTTYEGSATISNSAGQLLFYTDGVSVYNKNHLLMENGSDLRGNNTSTQSAIIVKKPKSSTIYYIFTCDAQGSNEGIKYSEVDLSLNGGLGAVTSNKNILLFTPTTEKLTAALNRTGEGVWVITHGYGSNNFYSFFVDNSGVNSIPVISSAGVEVAGAQDAIGSMKVAPTGDKLICANLSSLTELFNFNNQTGVVSNPRLITNKPKTYGVEFSQSGKIAYLTTGSDIPKKFELNQYDLTAINIPGSEINLVTTIYRESSPLALQLAPDGKIYVANDLVPYLSAIANPNVLGIGCNFQLKAVDLKGRLSYAGLPQFTPSNLQVTIKIQNNCLGESASFSLDSNREIIAAQWDFGDGNSSTDLNPNHFYSSIGNYTVSVKATSNTGVTTETKNIVIYELPTASQPQNISICDNNNDGFHAFDLTSQNAVILNGQDPNLYKVDYYVNAADYNDNLAINSPSTYTNTTAYLPQTIIASVTNKANPSCKSSTSFSISVNERPIPEISTAISNYVVCDNTSIGNDTDGRVLFDLTQKSSTILKGQSATQFLLSYYKDIALTQNITAPSAYANANATETIYVKMYNKNDPICFATTSFNIQVNALPTINQNVDLKQCDDDINGFTVFNLEEAIPKITANPTNESITFFSKQIDAQNNRNPITNPTNYSNQIINNDIVYARISNSNDCSKIATINLIVSTTQIPINFVRNFTVCDDAVLGTNTDGISNFDFSSVNKEIKDLFPIGQQLDITYYRNLNDALIEKNSILDIVNYRNIGYPNSQKIYVRIDSKLNNDCLGLGSPIQLTVEIIPVMQLIKEIQCDDNHDGFFAFDTSTIQTRLLNGSTNVTLKYFDENNNSLSSPLPNPFVTRSQIIKVEATNNSMTACSYETKLEFVVSDLPEASPIPSNLLIVCDDEIDPTQQDGKYAFDTSTFQNTILRGQTGMIVKYYDASNNLLSSPLPNPFVTSSQNIRVEVINSNNANCKATMTIPFVVHSLPPINLTGEERLCSNIRNSTKVINAALVDELLIDNYTYEWTYNGNIISGETEYTLTIDKTGTYTVKATSVDGCSRTRIIIVSASNIAKIENIKIEDLTSTNSIHVSATGTGDYVYALDDENSYYQSENLFTNVSAGMHTVYVKDLNGCGITLQEVAILGIPNFFTPNQDGLNDYWNIKGVNNNFNAKTIIYVFDRYGKLISKLDPLNQGWDGNFNGRPLPSDDYWYTVALEDGRILKGHFTLKR
ncbi:T9SS type B sorting domain-containing protein [Flavobacterium sp. CHNK8]|uniref:T9SS type B sorting domain-containing protein n=1 Tax=Flavobacterium sp. CHNK8 TaxID=2871165 RepID=UPI001C8D7E5B|nr:T9SS type B sorting domain-containing protein [Flavobacterium sp. CHNK8]QZK91542.1 T9SS type B sorting domain-containing protein [Flavobacterium sp. CHNK8]